MKSSSFELGLTAVRPQHQVKIHLVRRPIWRRFPAAAENMMFAEKNKYLLLNCSGLLSILTLTKMTLTTWLWISFNDI